MIEVGRRVSGRSRNIVISAVIIILNFIVYFSKTSNFTSPTLSVLPSL